MTDCFLQGVYYVIKSWSLWRSVSVPTLMVVLVEPLHMRILTPAVQSAARWHGTTPRTLNSQLRQEGFSSSNGQSLIAAEVSDQHSHVQ